MAALGWRTFWTPTIRGQGRHASGGVMILAPMHWDVYEPRDIDPILEPGRIHCVKWNSRRMGTVFVYNVYFEVGTSRAVCERNLTRLVNIRSHAMSHGLPYIVLGDLNTGFAAKTPDSSGHLPPAGPISCGKPNVNAEELMKWYAVWFGAQHFPAQGVMTGIEGRLLLPGRDGQCQGCTALLPHR